jgi:hypothetical protein
MPFAEGRGAMLGDVGTPSSTAPGPASGPPGAGPPGDRPASDRRRRLAVAAGTLFAVVTMGAWVWMLVIYDPGLLIDELEDRTFPEAAEEVCAVAVANIEALPRAEAAQDAAGRAAVVTVANQELATMLAGLRPLAPTEPPEAAEAVNEWLDDWDSYLADREQYAEDLARDPETRFTERQKGGKQISRAIDAYAQVNRMTSCETPGDVG